MEDIQYSSERLPARGMQAAIPPSFATYVDRWAIVVGISKYKHESLNLKYADRDAEALYELLLTPSGGGFEKDHVVKLLNEEATTANITRALRSFLKKPAKEDIVLIYFACHGAPDVDRPGIVYILTHDVDPTDISGTALPMREVDLSLKENLLAERVIILADTCHSAAIGGGIGRRDASNNSAIVNSYLREVGKSRGGIALLTSAEAHEVSFEDAKWGDGHGVFTHYLLEGMKGAADCNPRNGVVTVGELFEYVRENVQRATNNQQHPCSGTNSYDRNLPVTITAGISAQEHYELGCQLYQIGRKLDDQYCFEAASRHLKEAVCQAAVVSSKIPEAQLQLGLTLTASGDLSKDAITAFHKAIKAGVADADYHLGIAYLNQGDAKLAKQHLEAFSAKHSDSDKVYIARELISWLDASDSEATNRYALLIGINYSELKDDPQYRPLKGPANDIEILNVLLSQKFNFRIIMLSDMAATHDNIINAFNDLNSLAKPKDTVVIYFAGYEFGDSLVAADTTLNDQGERLNIISSKRFYELVDAIPSFNKHLILDVCINSQFLGFIEKIRQSKLCSLFLSTSPGQFAYETNISETQKTHGYFTYKLVEELWRSSENILREDLYRKVQEAVQSKFPNQTPFFFGDLNKPLFLDNLEHCPDAFTFSQQRCYSIYDNQALESLCQNFEKQFINEFPDFYYSLGLAFHEKANHTEALKMLEKATNYAQDNLFEILFSLGVTQFNNRLYGDAIQTFKECLVTAPQEAKNNLLDSLIEAIDELNQPPKRYALLIGVDEYFNPERTKELDDAVSNTLALRDYMVDTLGFGDENVKLLLNQDATHQNIRMAFEELLQKSQTSPAIFYYAGLGSVDRSENLTILAFDSRSSSISDINLVELSQLANHYKTNLTSIIDSNWSIYGRRYIDRAENSSSVSRKFTAVSEQTERDLSKVPRIGYVSLYSESVKYERRSYESGFTLKLIDFLLGFKGSELPSCNIFEEKCEEIDIYVDSEAYILNQPIFSNAVIQLKIRDLIDRIQSEPTRYTVLLLQHLIEQRNGMAPEEQFNLGVAYYVLREYEKSIKSLQTAIDLVSGQDIQTDKKGLDNFLSSVHYWLGRVLYESKLDPARAVSELRLVTQRNPENASAHYYLGQALRALADQGILTEAEQSLRTYLDAGSPLGQQEEVREFLKSRRNIR
jgi:uncharacterized caspase-like protein